MISAHSCSRQHGGCRSSAETVCLTLSVAIGLHHNTQKTNNSFAILVKFFFSLKNKSSKMASHSEVIMSVAPGVIEATMDILKTNDEDLALRTIGKSAKTLITLYRDGKSKRFWDQISGLALWCIGEGRLFMREQWLRALKDFEAFENWQEKSGFPIDVVHRLPFIFAFIIKPNALTSGLERMTVGYSKAKMQFLVNVLSICVSHLNPKSSKISTTIDQLDGELVLMVVDLLRSFKRRLQPKRSAWYFEESLKKVRKMLLKFDEAKSPRSSSSSESTMASSSSSSTSTSSSSSSSSSAIDPPLTELQVPGEEPNIKPSSTPSNQTEPKKVQTPKEETTTNEKPKSHHHKTHHAKKHVASSNHSSSQ